MASFNSEGTDTEESGRLIVDVRQGSRTSRRSLNKKVEIARNE